MQYIERWENLYFEEIISAHVKFSYLFNLMWVGGILKEWWTI